MRTLTQEQQNSITPTQALQLLKEGNNRFVNNQQLSRDLMKQARETSDGQYPYAVVLSCIDSRTSAELIFDQGLGDIFSIRIAGNVMNKDILGSMEFSCQLAGSKIIVVLGHTQCGAVKGACDQAEMGHLTGLLAKIKPAIDDETETKENRNSGHAAFVTNVTSLHVKRTVKLIPESSPILKEMIEANRIGIVGAMHDIKTGRVDFYPETFSAS